MELSERNKQELGKELPWILKHIRPSSKEFSVQMMDKRTFGLRCKYSIDECGAYKNSAIYLFAKDGRLVGCLEDELQKVSRLELRWKPFSIRRVQVDEWVPIGEETVEQALIRLAPDSDTVHFVLAVDFCSPWGVTLHKLPKGIASPLSILEREADKEVAQLREALR